MNWTIVNFGKFRGKEKTLPQIMFNDPDWFFDLMEKKIFENYGQLADEARDINFKAQHIKIPSSSGKKMVAEYYIHPSTEKFGDVRVVPEGQPLHEGASETWRQPCFSMAVPREISKYDKKGNRMHLQKLKYYLFGKSNYRITKNRAESFFNNLSNFEISYAYQNESALKD
ncbi:MAG: hypothetical protein PVH36_04970 [Desulfobacterales bacterium]|jgi:hypothetical protein